MAGELEEENEIKTTTWSSEKVDPLEPIQNFSQMRL